MAARRHQYLFSRSRQSPRRIGDARIMARILGFSVHRHDGAAGDAVLRRDEEHDRRRDFFDLRPQRVIGLGHGSPIGRRVHDRGRHGVDQNAVLGDFLSQRSSQRRDRGLARRIGHHAGAAAPFEAGAGRNIDDAAASGHGAHGGAAAQRAADEIHVDLLVQHRRRGFTQRRRRKAAGDVDRGPQRRDALIEAPNGRFVGQAAGDREPDALMVAQPEVLRLSLVEAGHVADRAGAEQNLDDRAAQRTGAAGDDDMPIAEIHAPSSPIRQERQGLVARSERSEIRERRPYSNAVPGLRLAQSGLRLHRGKNQMADFDLAVIGGGINGTGIARDAAGRGLRVVLVEQNDLASATSSASSKLIHGGLRYLEHYEFRLVRTALKEREVLLRAAPHLIRPLRFVLPVNEARRSALVLRLGLLIYDWIGWRRILPGTRELDLLTDAAGTPLRRSFHHAFEYSDCFADDARLVVLNAVDAAERGATIRTRTRAVRAERGDVWRLVLNARGRREEVTARVLVNAAGAWVETLAETVLRLRQKPHLRLDKGSHVVVRRLYDHDRAYILQAADGRVVFTIPFQRDFTLIGTPDQTFTGDPAAVLPTGAEIDYLCGVVNEYFRKVLGAADVVWAYAGVRSLYDDGARQSQDIGREYVLSLDERSSEAPLLTVY